MSDKPKWEKYGGEKKPTMKRRCTKHDYYDRSIYMITMATEGRRQLFGQIEGNSNCEKEAVSVKLSALGERVKECWDNIADYYPQVEPMKLCIMPDHIHGLLFVHEKMNSHLGKVIAGFKTGTRKAAGELGFLPALIAQDTEQTAEQPTATATAEQPAATAEQPTTAGGQPTTAGGQPTTAGGQPATAGLSAAVPYTALPAQSAATPSRHTAAGRAHGTLWEPNYHDRLLRGRSQLQRMITYMDENPYRRWIKQQHPEYFTRMATLTVANYAMQAMGNRFLLDNPAKIQIQCSRSLTPAEIESRKTAILDQAQKEKSVLVSPCISPGEQAITTAAMTAGIPLIVLLVKGFPPYFKPQPKYIEACATGLLLMISPFAWQNEKLSDMRQRCLLLNSIAAEISK